MYNVLLTVGPIVSLRMNFPPKLTEACVSRNKQTKIIIKGRFLRFRRYHNSINLFSKLSESTFYKEISKF